MSHYPLVPHNEHVDSPINDEYDTRQAYIAGLEQQVIDLQQQQTASTARIAELEKQLETYRTTQGIATHTTRLSTLLAISAALLVTHEIEPILELVVQEAVTLFPHTSAALLFLFDPLAQRLTLRAASRATVEELTIVPSQGISSHAFFAPRAMLLRGIELDTAINELDAQHIAYLQHIPGLWPPCGALIAPLRTETERLGALTLYCSTSDHPFLPRDLPFIQALADLTAVAINENYQRAHAAALQRDLAQTQSMHAEAQARLNTAQVQLLQSAKLAAVGELAASVAHEINNPLYAARNSLYLIDQDLPSDALPRPFLEIAQSELGRITRIITRMRDFYRPTRAELAPTDVNTSLIETIELVQTHLRHSQITVETTLTSHLVPIIAHADQLRQVFLNLMLNACDAMPDGGTLHVTTQLLKQNPEQVPTIIIRIQDTGTGISSEHLSHLFEPFYTTKPQGTGLGLAISAHIITQHGGQISVESTVGIGTTFTIQLPIERNVS